MGQRRECETRESRTAARSRRRNRERQDPTKNEQPREISLPRLTAKVCLLAGNAGQKGASLHTLPHSHAAGLLIVFSSHADLRQSLLLEPCCRADAALLVAKIIGDYPD
jgi:hypothetical protein